MPQDAVNHYVSNWDFFILALAELIIEAPLDTHSFLYPSVKRGTTVGSVREGFPNLI